MNDKLKETNPVKFNSICLNHANYMVLFYNFDDNHNLATILPYSLIHLYVLKSDHLFSWYLHLFFLFWLMHLFSFVKKERVFLCSSKFFWLVLKLNWNKTDKQEKIKQRFSNIYAGELWCWRRLLRVICTTRRSNQ